MNKLAILFTSRNNYTLLDKWLTEVNWDGYEVLNIDEDSRHLEVQKGKDVCKKHDITYMDRDKRGLLNNITTAMEYYQDSDVDWVIWFQHDCFPLTPNFFDRVNKVMSTGDLDDFGCVGFNTFHKVNGKYEKGDRSLHYVARAPLEPGDNWYRNHKQWHQTRVRLQTDDFQKPFSVEIPAAFCVALNLKTWKKYITPIDDYHFMNVFDEIGFQYLNQNIHNIVLPYLHIGHEPERKQKVGIPKVSSKAHKANQGGRYKSEHFNHDDEYFGKWGLSVFEERWGIDYDNARPSFEKIKDRYQGTLLMDFYNHDPAKGPLKTFDIEYEEDR